MNGVADFHFTLLSLFKYVLESAKTNRKFDFLNYLLIGIRFVTHKQSFKVNVSSGQIVKTLLVIIISGYDIHLEIKGQQGIEENNRFLYIIL